MAYEIKNLATKIDIILALMGEETLFEKLEKHGVKSPRDSISKYKDGGGIFRNTAKKYSDALDIPLELFEAPLEKFITIFYEKYNNIRRTFCFLREHSRSSLPIYRDGYKGVYFCWMRWFNEENERKNIYKFLIKISDIIHSDLIQASMTTHRHYHSSNKKNYKWGFGGAMMPISSNNFALLFENIDLSTGKLGCASIFVLRGNPDDGLWGIYTAEPAFSEKYSVVPTATRIFMKRVAMLDNVNEKELLGEMNWYDEESIEKDVDIDKLRNALDKNKLLTVGN